MLLTLALASILLRADDPVVLRFAFFGCNRVDNADLDPARNPSSANQPQLVRSFNELASISQRPQLVFAVGDLVNNYVPDKGENATAQLNAWTNLYRSTKIYGLIPVIPVPGNHETNAKDDSGKYPNPPATDAWNSWYRRGGYPMLGHNGPNSTTYSFDRKGVHFVVLNTDELNDEKDPATGKMKVGWIAWKWAAADIAKAQTNPAIRQIFILGHRNLIDPASVKGDAPIDPVSAAQLVKAIQAAPKVRGFLCAHVHAWDMTKIPGSSCWQVVAGNAGSKLEKDWAPTGGTYFGFTQIEVRESGRMSVLNFKRTVPKPYNAPAIGAKPSTVEVIEAG